MLKFALSLSCKKENIQASTIKKEDTQSNKKTRRRTDSHAWLPCWECNKFLQNKYTLAYHNRRFHTKEKPQFKCSRCPKAFCLERDLEQHYKIHKNRKAFKCTNCEKAFSSADKLNEHEIMHDPSKGQYICGQCGKKFFDEGNHRRHTKNCGRFYECTLCPKKLKSKDNFKAHVKKHSGVPDVVCNLCGLKYFTKARLKQHQNKKHGQNSTNTDTNNTETPTPSVAGNSMATMNKRQIFNNVYSKEFDSTQLSDNGYITHLQFI